MSLLAEIRATSNDLFLQFQSLLTLFFCCGVGVMTFAWAADCCGESSPPRSVCSDSLRLCALLSVDPVLGDPGGAFMVENFDTLNELQIMGTSRDIAADGIVVTVVVIARWRAVFRTKEHSSVFAFFLIQATRCVSLGPQGSSFHL